MKLSKLVLATLISTNLLTAEEIINQENKAVYGESILNDNKSVQPNNYVKSNFLPNENQANANNINDNAIYQQKIYNQTSNYQSYQPQEELSKDELELLKASIRNQNLNALQQRFFNKKYKGYENTLNIKYEENKTQKIRTRFAMATTLIFNTDITSYILGDTTGFKAEEIPSLPNAISIKPLLIGIDTSLTIFTKDNKIHTFYIYSTDYKNPKDPSLVVYIKDEESKKILDEKEKKLQDEYLIIKEGIAELRVKKDEIYNHYSQKGKKGNEWLQAEEIFNDNKFTYFKYDKNKLPKLPVIFAVIDKQDSPVETRVIGDYIIAETTNKKFTIRSGESYICVERLDNKAKK